MRNQANLQKDGMAQAAMLAAMIGVLTLALVNIGTEISKAFKEWVWDLGKLWIPGAQGIGPYSGKETLMLISWLGSWALLHAILKNRELSNHLVVVLFLTGIGVATTLLWPPVTHWAIGTLVGV